VLYASALDLGQPSAKEPRSFQVMLGLGGFVYLAWWFAVEWTLPGSFNPLPGRLVVVAYFLIAFALSFVSREVKRRAEPLFYAGALLLVGHYFYLFSHNARDINWTVGTYVVVFALCVGVQSRAWLYAFAAFSFACGLLVWLREPTLQKTIFLPGLATILALCLSMLLSRIRLLQSLAESTGRFQSLFDATFEGVAVHEGGVIIDVNASFLSLFGYTREELIGRPVFELNALPYRDRVAMQIRDVPTGRYESVGLRKDGSEFALEISTKPHVYQGRVLRLAAVRDITDRQRAEQERMTLMQEQAARASAQEAVRLRDEFISIASHELRTPITSLLLHLEALVRQRETRHSDQDFDTYTARARRQLSRMTRLIEELLDVSRLGAGHLTLKRETVDLELLVREVVDTLSEDVQRAGCKIEIRSLGSVKGFWDRLRLEQVVENLMRNAITYGPGKPIELTLRGGREGPIVLSIRDYGMGIDKSLQEKVFLRFERAVSARHYGGLGLGLYITKQIVDAHGGHVRVDSETGKGSTFFVELPSASSKLQGSSELGAPN
jgi:PAS domain S-box-containing protein